MKKSIATNTVFNVAYKLLNILFPLVTATYIARILGPVYLGKVTYAQNIMSYFLVVASLGIPTYGTREIARSVKNRTESDRVFSSLFIINLISTVICSLAYTAFIFVFGKAVGETALYLSVGLTLYMNILNLDWFFSGREEYVYITVRSFIIKTISVISIFIFVHNKSDYVIYALITSIATTGNYVLSVLNMKKKVSLRIRGLEFKRHMKPVFILLMTLLATDLYNQIDVTMIGSMCIDADVAYYSSAVKIIRIVYSITTAISATIVPRMCMFYKEHMSYDFQKLFMQTMKTVVIIALPCVVGLWLVAEPLTVILFGSEFLPTAKIIQILSPIILIITVSYLSGSVVLTATNREKMLLTATLCGAAVNAFLNSILIPVNGTTGAAIASIAGELAVLTVHIICSSKYVKFDFGWLYLISSISATAVMALIVRLLMKITDSYVIMLIVAVPCGAISYFTMLFIMSNPLILLFWNSFKKRIRKSKR